jgi:hypothetical protein
MLSTSDLSRLRRMVRGACHASAQRWARWLKLGQSPASLRYGYGLTNRV